MALSRITLPLAVLAFALAATSANAVTLKNAAVTGPSGAIWTTAQTGDNSLFLQTPNLGDFLNPNDESISVGIPNDTIERFLLAGEGFVPGQTANSDSVYSLTLDFDTGQTLTGSYAPTTNTFLGGSSFISGGQAFSLIEFSFRRDLGDRVQSNVASFGGDGNDYTGNFRIQSAASAVPEPAAWAMMIGGFGLAGASMRRRSHAVASA